MEKNGSILEKLNTYSEAYSVIAPLILHTQILGLLQGAYTISASAYDASMNYLGTSNQVAQNINAPNKITDLGVITIPISTE